MLLGSRGADLAIQFISFNSLCGAVGIKVQLDNEVEPVNHVRGVYAIIDKSPGLMLDPASKVRDCFIREGADGVDCSNSLNWLAGVRDGFCKGNSMV